MLTEREVSQPLVNYLQPCVLLKGGTYPECAADTGTTYLINVTCTLSFLVITSKRMIDFFFFLSQTVFIQ